MEITIGEILGFRNDMKKKVEYKGQLIIIHSPDVKCNFYLFNADGDIDSYPADTLEKAKSRIDEILERQGGYYDSDGNLITDFN